MTDNAYQAYISASREDSGETFIRLRDALELHARAVCFEVLNGLNPLVVERAVEKGVKGLESFKGNSKFSTWFHTVARNTCIDFLRTQTSPLTDVHAYSMDKMDLKILIDQIFNKVTPAEAALLRLKYEGASDEEVSEELRISLSASKQRWKRLREKIQRLITSAGGSVGTVTS